MDKIQGPVSLTEYFSTKYNKHIYLFGDVHVNASTCDDKNSVHIVDFLKDIINNAEITDVFIEALVAKNPKKIIPRTRSEFFESIRIPEITKKSSYLDMVRNEFRNCLLFDKTKCKYIKNENARFHYIDIRTVDVIVEQLFFERFVLRQKREPIGVKEFERSLNDMLQTEVILEESKITKQIENIKDVKIREVIDKVAAPKLKMWNKTLERLIDTIPDLSDKKSKEFLDWLKVYDKWFLEFSAYLMDMFTIGRMMRTFSDGTTASGPVQERKYNLPGTYSEILKVVDSKGNIDYDFAVVQVRDKKEPEKMPPSIHANYYPSLNIKPGDPLTFKVRTFRTDVGNEVWDFGDGTSAVKTKSKVERSDPLKHKYAETVHKYEKPGHYIVTVERSNELGYKATAHLHIEVIQ